MESYIITDVSQKSKGLGAKTTTLWALSALDITTLPFVGIPHKGFQKCISEEGALREEQLHILAGAILEKLPAERYAVRSSALIEDTGTSSQAGQFKTELNVSCDELAKAIGSVLSQAYERLGGDMAKFSLLIQEFKEPKLSGVIFSRDPNDWRDAVIDYTKGVGEKVVGGEVSNSVRVQNGRLSVHVPALKHRELFVRLADIAKEIEVYFGAPQDIEWALCGRQLYILQSRPITTITEEQYKALLQVEKTLPEGEYYFDRESVTQSVVDTRPLPISILEALYKKGGPIDEVYKKYDIDYTPTGQFVRIGGSVYVDKEKELHSILPAFTYFKKRNGTTSLGGFDGLGKTILNNQRIQGLSIQGMRELERALEKHLAQNLDEESVRGVWNKFLLAYKTIFEINLLAEHALARLSRIAKITGINEATLLSSGVVDVNQLESPEGVSGNSLDISDQGVFVEGTAESNRHDIEGDELWKILSDKKKKEYQRTLNDAATLERLREYARWVTVKYIHNLREKIKDSKSVTKELMYCADIESIIGDTVQKDVCARAKEKHEAGMVEIEPPHFASFPIAQKRGNVGVSKGIAEGVLVKKEDIAKEENPILFVETLSPDITEYFERVSGIVSTRGSVLSHLAIMARERGIPVVVSKEAHTLINTKVKIDGTTGEITEGV